ncbi:hypothetical protein M3231_03780 [Neobacillus mesonae]|nr:hypothetical protein [Neobacillus mesonae]
MAFKWIAQKIDVLVEFDDQTLYAVDQFKVIEGNKITSAMWIPIYNFEIGKRILYPNGLTELLEDL